MTRGTIVVVGDVMIDSNQESASPRLSPEAPVVVMTNPTATHALGGSANTAANVRALGHEVVSVGLIGHDEAGDLAVRLLAEREISNALVVSATHRTTIKTRFRVGGQQLMRLDYEDTTVNAADAQALAATTIDALEGAAAVVISDYRKGVVTDELARAVISQAQASGIPVVVDSKKTDLSCFEGASVIAPNHHEAKAATGHDDPQAAARAISDVTRGAVIVTMGVNGMIVFDGGEFVHIPTLAHEVSDVTGAGDTVTAALAVALAEGASVVQAARWATAAAAEAVAHRGTYAVPRTAVPIDPVDA